MSASRQNFFILAIFLSLINLSGAAQSQPNASPKIQSLINDYVKEKSKVSGKWDMYDEKADFVRNLELVAIQPEVKTEGDKHLVDANLRDFRSGDIVTVTCVIVGEGNNLKIEENQSSKVQKSSASGAEPPAAASSAAQPAPPINPDDAQKIIKEKITGYVEKKSKFTESFDLYDQGANKMRRLEMSRIDDQARNFGVVFINRVEFKDKDSGQTVGVDFQLENGGGSLEIKSVNIKDVK